MTAPSDGGKGAFETRRLPDREQLLRIRSTAAAVHLPGHRQSQLQLAIGLSPVAEVHGSRLTAYDIGQEGDLANRRMWATAGDDHPDGICIDAERAVWYADVGNRHCVRVREGGEILATVDLNRGAFACTLSRDDKPQLYVVGQQFGGPETAEPTGQVVVFPAPAAGAGKP